MIRNNRLNIFDNFIVDRELPKHKKENKRPTQSVLSSSSFGRMSNVDSDDADVEPVLPFNEEFSVEGGSGVFMVKTNRPISKQNWFQKLCSKLFKKKPVIEIKTPVQEVFAQLAKNTTELTIVKNRINGYEKIRDNAIASGQKALVEQIEGQIKVFYLETALLKSNFNKFISEEKLVEFAKKCERGLKLDWVKNFVRVIPNDVLDEKIKADTLKVFDNYVVLHYDPENKSTQLTKEEIEKKKDPILFGVIEGSTKLYFIGDWTDEICDLTWDTIADLLGSEVMDEMVIKTNIETINDIQ